MDNIYIWGEQIPYNSGECKKNVMDIQKKPVLFLMPEYIRAVFGEELIQNKSCLDTYTYKKWIHKGKESEHFDDKPTLQAFLAEKSDTAVIIAPGGAFCYKEIEKEGYETARFLNEHGISAFVLNYRLNPYKAPVCYLDMQRAIRYVRHHADEYGINPGKIGIMGFSAGGYVAGAAAVLLGNAPVDCEGYIEDEVDKENGIADFVGLIYPVTGFDRNPNMLSILTGEDFFDERKRKELQAEYSLSKNVTADCPPQYLCYGDKDFLKDMIEYGDTLKKINADFEMHVLPGAGHGFQQKKYSYWKEDFVRWVKQQTRRSKNEYRSDRSRNDQ